MTTINNMKVRRFATRLQYSMIALVLMNISFARHGARWPLAHAATKAEMTRDQQSDSNALVKIVRDSTERFKDVSVAEAEGYALQFGCVSGDDFGAMGLHYVNGDLGEQRRPGRHSSPDRDL